jgi:hypothetical protein
LDIKSGYIVADKFSIEDKKLSVLKIGWILTLYFEKSYSMELRNSIAECFEEYIEICKENIRWVAHPKSYTWKRLAKEEVPTPTEWFESQKLDENDGWEFFYHGGNRKDEASHYTVRAVGTPKMLYDKRGRLSYISASFPPTWFENHKINFPEFVLNWCEKIKPLHGYGGIGILESPEYSVAQNYEKEVYALAKRFPGLEVDYPDVHVLYLRGGIKGINWITIMDEKWVEMLGGEKLLKSKLDTNFKIYGYSQGIAIQAGKNPEIGDVNRNLDPKYYRKLSKVSSSIRIKNHKRFHGITGFGPEETQAWIDRFDSD